MFVSLVNSQILLQEKSAALNALENSFGLFWNNLYILWKSSRYISSRFVKIYVLKIGENCEENIRATEK